MSLSLENEQLRERIQFLEDTIAERDDQITELENRIRDLEGQEQVRAYVRPCDALPALDISSC